MSTTLRRSREVGGPGLKGPGVRAKLPYDRPPEHMILARRADDEARGVFETMLMDEHKVKQRIGFEEGGDARIRRNMIKTKTDALVADADAALEARRKKLAALLAAEEEQYVADTAALVETPIQRLARMRDTAKSLREKRESERTALVTQKLDDLWKSSCEPLRTAVVAQEQKLLNEDRMQQIEHRRMLERMDNEVNDMYDVAWEQDRLAKEERDRQDVASLNISAKEAQSVQLKQMEEKQQKQTLEKMAVAELQALRLETAKELEAELIREKELERSKKDRLKRILDADASERAAFRESLRGGELAEETAMLDQLEQERRDEERLRAEEKARLAAEQRDYFEYLKTFADRRAEFEAEVDASIHEMGEQVWQNRLKKMRAERENRKKIVAEILEVRKTQMAYHEMVKHADKQAEITDRQAMERDADAFKLQSEAEQAKRREDAIKYQEELTEQIAQRAAAEQADRAAAEALAQSIRDDYRKTEEKINLAVTAVRMPMH